jgi:hypothetical protein
VFGKLAATSLNALYGVMAVFPVMAIPILLGGVTVAEFWRVVVCCLNNLFFSLAVGMFCSAVSREETKATVMSLALILFFTGGLPLIGGLLSARHLLGIVSPAFFVPSPGYMSFLAFDEIQQMLTRTKFNYFYASLAAVHVLGWCFLGLACYVVPRTWQDRADSEARARRRKKVRDVQYGEDRKRRGVRAAQLDLNPYYWLVSRDRFKPAIVWGVLGLGGGVWLWGLLEAPNNWIATEAFVTTAFFLYVVFSSWIATESARRFALDRRSGALELILSTPLSVRRILRGQLAGLKRQFLAPLLVVYAALFVFLIYDREDLDMVIFWTAAMGMFALDLMALAMMGMWNGLASGHIGRSSSKGIFTILLLPWVIWGIVMTLLGISDFFSQRFFADDNRDWVPRFIIMARIAIGLAIDALMGCGCWGRLDRRFREVATQAVVTRRRFWPFG